MNMSDDVTGTVLSTSANLIEKGVDIGGKVADSIAKLMQFLASLGNKGKKTVSSSDMTDINAGTVKIEELTKNARALGDTIVSADGFSKQDAKFIAKKCKENGIPVAFSTISKDADNVCVCVRGSDKAIFDKIATECIKDKLNTRPKELSVIKVEKWQIEGIQNELRDNDLCANFGQLKNGEYFCLCKKSEEKAVLMARGQFQRKCKELDENFSVTKVGDGVIMGGETASEATQVNGGFFVIRDAKGAAQLSFDADNIPSRSEFARQVSEAFGYDANKAELAANKFAEENLSGSEKMAFLSDDPKSAFAKIETNIELKGESVLAKDYDCMRLTPEEDGIPRLTYMDDNGNFAVLNPEKQTREKMTAILQESFPDIDKETASALVDKAQGVTDYYNRQNGENFTHSKTFEAKDFGENSIVSERQDNLGNRMVKPQPVNTVDSDISRTGKNSFVVNCTATSKEFTSDGAEHLQADNRKLTLSLSDKKSAVSELKAMYTSFGVPDHTAAKMAKEVFGKAQAQSAEKVIQIEEIRVESKQGQDDAVKASVKCGNQEAEVDLSDPEKAKEVISEQFEVSPEEAENVVDMAQEKSGVSGVNGHEKNPSEVLPDARNNNAPKPPGSDIPAAEASKAAKPDMPKMPDVPSSRKR